MPPAAVQRERERVETADVLGLAELALGLLALDEVPAGAALVVLRVAAVALHDGARVAGRALHPLVPRDAVLGRAGDDLAAQELPGALRGHQDLAALREHVRVGAALGGERHPVAGPDGPAVLARLAQGQVALAGDRDEGGRALAVAVAVLAPDLELAAHVGRGVALAHHLARGVAVDALHAGEEVDVGRDVGEVPPVARAQRPRPAALRRDEAVVAVHQALVAQGVPAAPLVAGEAGFHRGQALHRVRLAVRALALHRRVAAAVDRPLAVGEVARRAAGGVPVAVERLVLPRDVAARAELPVEVAREVVELPDRHVLHRRPVERVGLSRGRGVRDPRTLALPRRLDLADHARVGEHLVAVHPLDLVAVARLAAELPAAGERGVGDAVDPRVGRILRLPVRVAAVAGDAALVRGRGRLDAAVAAQAACVGLDTRGSMAPQGAENTQQDRTGGQSDRPPRAPRRILHEALKSRTGATR